MTLKQMAEQVILRYKGSRPTQDTDLDEREVYDLIIKVMNIQLKTEHMEIHLPQQERFVPNAAITTYEVDVKSEAGSIYVNGNTLSFGKFIIQPDGWATDGGDPWVTEGDEVWLTGGIQSISIIDKKLYYDISISRFVLPHGKTDKMLYDFIAGGNSNSYITLVGLSDGVPNIFAKIGMRDIVVTPTTIKFKYYVTDATTVDDEILKIIGPTIDKLSTADYYEVMYDIQRTDNTVIDSRGRAFIDIPAQPIALPRGMGIWHIGDHRDINSAYIPIQPGETAVLRGVSHTGVYSMIGRLTAYEWYNRQRVYFNKKASQMPSKVLVRLVVADPNTIGEYDLLPIPADKEFDVIVKVLELLKADGDPDVKTDKLP